MSFVENLNNKGFERHSGALNPDQLEVLKNIIGPLGRAAGHRLTKRPDLEQLLVDSGITAVARFVLGRAARPVRALLFDKTSSLNWALGWHQDRTIAVCRRADVPGFDHWNVKRGVVHVEPPFSLIGAMITARLHLDDVDENNAPLKVAPGSHKLGRIAEDEYEAVVGRCGIEICLAEAGDVWFYRTPILHASDASHTDARRRVLQVDFCAKKLPAPLGWLGIS